MRRQRHKMVAIIEVVEFGILEVDVKDVMIENLVETDGNNFVYI